MKPESRRSVTLLAAAAGASFASTADAAAISTAPPGFTPVVLQSSNATTPAGSIAIDLDGDGVTDLQFQGGILKPFITIDGTVSGLNSQAVIQVDPNGFALAFADPSGFTDFSSTSAGTFGFLNNFTDATPYGEVGLLVNASVDSLAYFKGVSGTDGSFTLQDYGLIETPEPASLALLAAGVAGLAAFRRRQATRPA